MHNIESRDQIIEILSNRIEALEKEIERLKGELSNEQCDSYYWKEKYSREILNSFENRNKNNV